MPTSRKHAESIRAMRLRLGKAATIPEVADGLGLAISTVRRALRASDLADWAEDVRAARRVSTVDRAIRRLKARTALLSRVPTARESGLHSSVMMLAGGYNALVRKAGLRPRHPRGVTQ